MQVRYANLFILFPDRLGRFQRERLPSGRLDKSSTILQTLIHGCATKREKMSEYKGELIVCVGFLLFPDRGNNTKK